MIRPEHRRASLRRAMRRHVSQPIPLDGVEADRLSSSWRAAWGELPPMGPTLRQSGRGSWQRRYIRQDRGRGHGNDVEYGEAAGNTSRLLLQFADRHEGSMAVATSWAEGEVPAWIGLGLPRARHWFQREHDGNTVDFWVAPLSEVTRINPLVDLVLADLAEVTFASADFAYLAHPYDGGVDFGTCQESTRIVGEER